MKNSKSINLAIVITILGLSLAFWMVLLFNPINLQGSHSHHPLNDQHTEQLTQMNSMSGLLIGWVFMVFAMMLPKLISPIQHIYVRSLKRKRLFLSLLFILGYSVVWTFVGLLFYHTVLGLNIPIATSYIPAAIIGVIAIVWQFSPIKQRFLNLGHDHLSLRPFGMAANIDALYFGIMHGLWCFGSGWALMFFPMLLPTGHHLAMVFVALIMVSEHMEQPQVPKWRFNLRMKLLRIAVVQTTTRLRLQSK